MVRKSRGDLQRLGMGSECVCGAQRQAGLESREGTCHQILLLPEREGTEDAGSNRLLTPIWTAQTLCHPASLPDSLESQASPPSLERLSGDKLKKIPSPERLGLGIQ